MIPSQQPRRFPPLLPLVAGALAVAAIIGALIGPSCSDMGGEYRPATTIGGYDSHTTWAYSLNPATGDIEYRPTTQSVWNPDKVVHYKECVGATVVP